MWLNGINQYDLREIQHCLLYHKNKHDKIVVKK